jgi:hypothetical protein
MTPPNVDLPQVVMTKARGVQGWTRRYCTGGPEITSQLGQCSQDVHRSLSACRASPVQIIYETWQLIRISGVPMRSVCGDDFHGTSATVENGENGENERMQEIRDLGELGWNQ